MSSNINENIIINDSNYKAFIEYIINGMDDWVRVIDINDKMIFVNNAMSEALKGNLIGYKCYEAIGRKSPCENCTSRKAVFAGASHHKEEIIGDRIFSVMSSPIKDNEGNVIAVVEVLRDITDMKKLQKKILDQNKKLQSELNMAKKLQCSLLPKGDFKDSFDLSYIYKPCETLGGDFLDIFKIDDNHFGLYIADVSGHGVSASMLTVFLRSSLNKYTLSPSEALSRLYEDFNKIYYDQDLYITIFYAIIDVKNYSLTYSNAGHNVPPVLFNFANKFELLRVPGIPISNWVEEPAYKDRVASLEKGDRIFLYTDGIVELKNNKNEQFGEERLLNVLLNNQSNPAIILNQIIDIASEFACIKNFNKISDDVTMIFLEMK